MNYEYQSFTCQAGALTEKINHWAKEGFRMHSFRKDGNHFYVVMEKSLVKTPKVEPKTEE